MKILAVLVVLVLAASVALMLRPGFGSFERWLAPNAHLWPKWQAHDAASNANIDHRDWSGFLEKYVTQNEQGVALVDYGAVTSADGSALESYIQGLSNIRIATHNREVQLAYWINIYNAVTVQVVLDNFPVASIRDIKISPGLFDLGPWDRALVTIDGEPLTINDIEHRILRPIWRDPRLHYVLNCASIGCPNLGGTAYSANQIEEQLDTAARDYVNGDRGVRIVDGQISVSRIYDWFVEDFGGTERAVLEHLSIYARPELDSHLSSIGGISGQHYDWALNGAVR